MVTGIVIATDLFNEFLAYDIPASLVSVKCKRSFKMRSVGGVKVLLKCNALTTIRSAHPKRHVNFFESFVGKSLSPDGQHGLS